MSAEVGLWTAPDVGFLQWDADVAGVGMILFAVILVVLIWRGK